jgi:hypothetical protein
MKPFDSVFLGGGGMSSAAQLAFLHHLIADGLVADDVRICGVSAGSIVGLSWVLRLTPADTIRIVHDVCSETIPAEGPNYDIATLITSFGLLDVTAVVSRLVDSLVSSWWWAESTAGSGRAKLARPATLRELEAATGRSFQVVVTDTARMTPVVLSAASHPDVKLCDAIAASCAVPLVFAPVSVAGMTCADGAVMLSRFGDRFLADETRDGRRLLVLQVCREEGGAQPRPDDLVGYITALVSMFLEGACGLPRVPIPGAVWWDIPVCGDTLAALIAPLSPERATGLFEKGRMSYQRFVEREADP